MQSEIVFRVALPLLIFAFVAHRGYYGAKFKETAQSTLKKRKEGPASRIAGALGVIGLASLLAYVVKPEWMSWGSLPLPLWLRWSGLGVAFAGFALLQSSQDALGENWSDHPRMIKGQGLVTNGPYRFIRHPIYAAILLVLSSTFLLSANWMIGLLWLGMTALEISSRIRYEESLMLEFFGEQYREYMKRTGRIAPRLF
ncbi:MAG: isoprenylcysteine carboxylmethyltransferase family protein [Chloroflexota bacterium]